MTLDNQFRPLPVDDGDELFPNGIFEFNISKLTAFIQSNLGQFIPEEIEVQSLHKFTANNLNELTIKTANLSEPIILAEISPGRFNVIDGHHRLEKAHRYDIEKITAYRVYAEQHIAFLTSVRAYSAYLEYWNLKVDDYNRPKQ